MWTSSYLPNMGSGCYNFVTIKGKALATFALLGLAKRVDGSTRLQPMATNDPFTLDPNTNTTRPMNFHGSLDTTREPV